jgi:predicted ATPase
LLLLENPETHLHPKGQSKLARLMALTAQAGVQIICETHSDHIINGTLVACKEMERGQQGIDRNNVHIFYIDKNDDTPENNKVTLLNVEAGIKIINPPKGFFDQYKTDIRQLI